MRFGSVAVAFSIVVSSCAIEPAAVEGRVVDASALNAPSDVLASISTGRNLRSKIADIEGQAACSIFAGATSRDDAAGYFGVVYELPESPLRFERLHLAGSAYCPNEMSELGYSTPNGLLPSDPMWDYEPTGNVSEVASRVEVMNALKNQMQANGLFDRVAWDHQELYDYAMLSCDNEDAYSIWKREEGTTLPINLPGGLTDHEVLERAQAQSLLSQRVFCG